MVIFFSNDFDFASAKNAQFLTANFYCTKIFARNRKNNLYSLKRGNIFGESDLNFIHKLKKLTEILFLLLVMLFLFLYHIFFLCHIFKLLIACSNYFCAQKNKFIYILCIPNFVLHYYLSDFFLNFFVSNYY